MVTSAKRRCPFQNDRAVAMACSPKTQYVERTIAHKQREIPQLRYATPRSFERFRLTLFGGICYFGTVTATQ